MSEPEGVWRVAVEPNIGAIDRLQRQGRIDDQRKGEQDEAFFRAPFMSKPGVFAPVFTTPPESITVPASCIVLWASPADPPSLRVPAPEPWFVVEPPHAAAKPKIRSAGMARTSDRIRGMYLGGEILVRTVFRDESYCVPRHESPLTNTPGLQQTRWVFGLLAAVVGALIGALRPRAQLVAENLALRQQLAVLRRKKARPRLVPMDRASGSCSRASGRDGRMLSRS